MSSLPPLVVCLDASFVMRLLQNQGTDAPVVQQWLQWKQASILLAAPTLIYYELSNALYRLVRHGELSAIRADESMRAALALQLTLYGDAELHRQALHLAQALSLPATYDAHYLALAQRLGAAFWTADRRLAQLVQPVLPWVHLLE
jgi:predicted nucleic acid-binding protein